MIENVLIAEYPDPDSHFRLLPCRCGGRGMYRCKPGNFAKIVWQVKCEQCQRQTAWFRVKHNAQVSWNTEFEIYP